MNPYEVIDNLVCVNDTSVYFLSEGHHGQEKHSDWYSILDGTRGDPGNWLQLCGWHLVPGYHFYRDGRRKTSLCRHPSHESEWKHNLSKKWVLNLTYSLTPPDCLVSSLCLQAIFMIPTNPPPTFRKPELWSDEFTDFVKKCLVKNPEQRATATQLLQVRGRHTHTQRYKHMRALGGQT